jgi:nucleoside-diphosphate-sugar epimerase
MSRTKVLLIGGAGYVGVHLTKYLSSRGYEIAVFDKQLIVPNDLEGVCEYINGDVASRYAIKNAIGTFLPGNLTSSFNAVVKYTLIRQYQ